MLIFESISAGGVAILLTLLAVLVLVGIYAYFPSGPSRTGILNGLGIVETDRCGSTRWE